MAEGTSNTLPYTYEEKTGNIYASSLFATNFQYLNAERIGPRAIYEKLNITRPHSPIGYRGEYTASRLLDAVTNLEKVELSTVILKGAGNNIYEQLSAWISEIIYPGTRVNPDESDPARIRLQYSFREEQTKTFNPLNVGFGFSFALPVILAILTAKPGSLLIVENPEAHLHPKGQAKMGKLLALAAMSGVQIILESHSDHILNGIRIAVKEHLISPEIIKLIFFGTNLRSDEKSYHKEEPKIDQNGRIDNWPKDFFDTWEYALMDLL
jgi:predicted ATPase